jgi:hypothetical protein
MNISAMLYVPGLGHADFPEDPEPAGLNTDERLARGWGGVL